MGVAVDTQGDAYLTGQTSSDTSGPFPVTSGAYQSSLSSPDGDVFVTEISTTQPGTQSLVYSTYFGGSTSSFLGDWGEAVTLDGAGKVYVTGDTETTDFPTTSGAFQTTNSAGGKAFAAKFDFIQSGTQSLTYSTFLGGTDGPDGENGMGVAVDANGDAFIAGETSASDFPTTSGALSTTPGSDNWHGFLTQLNPGGTGLLYSTYLGGSCTTGLGDNAVAVALDSLSNPYVTGFTCSSDFPITTGAYQTSLAGSSNGFVLKLALNANPGITASPSPGPNASGWNNSAVTVSFTCIPGGAPIQSCTSPTTVSTEGAAQVVTGTAVDTANNTATASDTVNLDLTAPTLTITSPANNSTVSTSYVVITGTLTDSLSGPGSVNCNGVPAALTGTNFSCTLQLSSVSNSIVVTGYDVAGNTASSTLTVGVSMPAPTSLTVSPASPNMIVGGTQAFTAIDQTGTTRPDATWSVSDATIASFPGSSPNALVGNAAGTVTVTATVGGVTGQTTVTVLSGSSLAVGTVLWSAPAPAGYTTQKIVQAVPTANGPDLYAIDTDNNTGTMVLVQALKSDGEQLWQTSNIPSGFGPVGAAFGDNSGGLVIESSLGAAEQQMIDLSGSTGDQNWTYTPSGTLLDTPAVGLDGTVYEVEAVNSTTNADYLDFIDGNSGVLKSQIELPTSTNTDDGTACENNPGIYTNTGPGQPGQPMVGPDGSISIEVQSIQSYQIDCTTQQPNDTINGSISLLQVTPNGGTQYTTLDSVSGTNLAIPPILSPGDVIPDGQGGVLASWTTNGESEFVTIADAGPQGLSESQFSNVQFVGADGVVLGDNNTAFVTDGTNVVSFNPTSLQQNWAYTSTSGGTLTFVAATSGAGVTINDSQLGVIQLDGSGNPSTPISALQGGVPYQPGIPLLPSIGGTELGQWAIDGPLVLMAGPSLDPPASPYPEGSGDAQDTRQSSPTATITVNLTRGGHKTDGDKLSFIFVGVLNTCDEILGPIPCTGSKGTWAYNIEGHATVSDDAFNWVGPHQKAAVLVKGQSKDASGQLQPFTDSFSVDSPDEDPGGDFVQASMGTKSIFWLDAPGIKLHRSDGTTVDQATGVWDFTSWVCLAKDTSICATVNWYVKIVIDPGGNLDYTQSTGGIGSLPLNF